jgi:hypothetical protein
MSAASPAVMVTAPGRSRRPATSCEALAGRSAWAVCNQAAEDEADCAADARNRAEGAERPVALSGLGEDRREQAQSRGGHHRAPEPLQGPADQERLLVRRQTAQERRGAEDEHPQDEEATSSVQVARPAAQDQETAEGQGVQRHDVLEVRLAQAEIRPQRRQGDVHDRRVEHDHELGGAEQEQRGSAVAGAAAGVVDGGRQWVDGGHVVSPVARSRRGMRDVVSRL